jgi:hypothetical protein
MKYAVTIALVIVGFKTYSIVPLPEKGNGGIFIIRDTIVPERTGNRIHYGVGNKMFSEMEIDSLIDRAIKETMQDLRKKKLLTKSK